MSTASANTKLLVYLLLALLVAALLRWYFQDRGPPGSQRPPVAVVAVAARMTQLENRVEALATVKANESVAISATITESIAGIFFEDGDNVEAGQLLVKLTQSEELAEVKLAEVELNEQKREYNRITDLVARKSIAASELDRLQSQVEAARARLETAHAKLSERNIHAPFKGVVGFRRVSKGTLVTPGTVITTLDDIATVKLDFTVPERFLSDVNVGNTVEARADAYPGQQFNAKIATVETRINPDTRALLVRAVLQNSERKLRPGMLLKINLIQGRHQGLVVPEEALFSVRKQHFVYALNPDDTVVKKAVRIGMRREGIVEIVDGISEGEQIISRGQQKVREGDVVKVQQEDWRQFLNTDED